ncbi:MAG: DUF11 domain-containing protein, partial [Chloroflexi bacterium]|nr:DUF11 domain-containing protein [Chloroflexota bacterium]
MFALFLAFVSANAAAIDGNLSSGDIDVDGLTRHPVTGAIDPNYILGSITYTQDQASGDFAGLEYRGEDANYYYFAFEQFTGVNDNTYGANSDPEWGVKGHSFKALVKSEHIKVDYAPAGSDLEFYLDYLEADPSAKGNEFFGPFHSEGPDGGDGTMVSGDRALIAGWGTSLEWNLDVNGRVGTEVDSPATPNDADGPAWIMPLVYEWAIEKFDPASGAPVFPNGAGAPLPVEAIGLKINEVHNSPLKQGTNPVPEGVLELTKTSNPVSDDDGVWDASLPLDPPQPGQVNNGDEIVYTVKVRNAGTASLSDIVVTDTLDANLTFLSSDPSLPGGIVGTESGGVVTWNIGTLAAGAEEDLIFTAKVTLVENPDPAITIPNFAVASWTNSFGVPASGETNRTFHHVPGQPGIDLVKSGSLDLGADGIATPGDLITYSFTVTNTGNLTLTNVTLDDPLVTVIGGPIATLAVGASDSTTFSGTYAITQPDIDAGQVDNIAVATGTPSVGDDVSDSDTHTEPILALPLIDLVKSLASNADEDASGTVSLGDTLTYEFAVTNTGNVTLTDVTVDDPLPGLSVVSPASVASLAPGASTIFSATYSVTQDDVDAGQIDNTATTSGTPPSGPDVTDTDPETVPVPQNPVIELVKSLASNADEDASGTVSLGDTLTYEFVVTNTGNVTLTDVTVADPLPGLSVVSPASVASLAVGASTTFSATYPVTQDDVDAGQIDNTATASGTPPIGPDVTDTDPETVPVPQNPGILVVKTPDVGDPGQPLTVPEGGTVVFGYTVTNTGNVSLSGVTLSDNLEGSPSYASGDTDGDGLLDVDETWIYSAGHTVSQSDLDAGIIGTDETTAWVASDPGVATVVGISPSGSTVTSDNPGGVLLVQIPAIQLVKSGSLDLGVDGIATPGDLITYSFTVTNTGNLTLTNVTVSDPLIAVSGGPIASLAPLAVDGTTFTGSYAITQADIDAGKVDNIATTSGTAPDGTGVSDDDTHTEPVPANPVIELLKSGSLDLGVDGIANPGDVITYSFTVTNTGNVTLTGVTVSDPLVTVIGGPLASLAVGASDGGTFSGSYALTQADIDAG